MREVTLATFRSELMFSEDPPRRRLLEKDRVVRPISLEPFKYRAAVETPAGKSKADAGLQYA
jgi:hypothetical protein